VRLTEKEPPVRQLNEHPLGPDALNRVETAQFLGVCQRTVGDWQAKGILPPIRYGGRVFWLRSDLERFKADARAGIQP
jgi:hypothetical protein